MYSRIHATNITSALSGQPDTHSSAREIAQKLISVAQSPHTLNLAASEAQPEHVPPKRTPYNEPQHLAVKSWLRSNWFRCQGESAVARLITLLKLDDVPPILCQTMLHAMLREIDPWNAPILVDVKKAYISIGIGTTDELTQWVKQTWLANQALPEEQRILLLLETSPAPNLMNASTLHAILWYLFGDDAPAQSRLKTLATREWGKYWLSPAQLNWVAQRWPYMQGESQQAKVEALLRLPDLPFDNSVSILTAALEQLSGNNAPSRDTVARAVRYIRKENASKQAYPGQTSIARCAEDQGLMLDAHGLTSDPTWPDATRDVEFWFAQSALPANPAAAAKNVAPGTAAHDPRFTEPEDDSWETISSELDKQVATLERLGGTQAFPLDDFTF